MHEQTLVRLLAKQKKHRQETARFRIGTVTDDSPFTVAIDGSAVGIEGVAKLAAYTPTTNDRVAVLVQGYDLLVLGEIG